MCVCVSYGCVVSVGISEGRSLCSKLFGHSDMCVCVCVMAVLCTKAVLCL